MTTLYSYWRSSASYRVRIALALKGIDYETRVVDLIKDGGEQYGADYRARNPQSRVPMLVDGPHSITQSLAIIEYLDETHPAPPLMPPDAYGRARVRSLAQIVACDMQQFQNTSTIRYLKHDLGLDDARVRDWMQHWLSRGFAALEAHLAGEPETGKFCHGDAPTLADCCLVPQCYAGRRFGVDPAAYPTISRIETACVALDAFRRAAPEAQPDRD